MLPKNVARGLIAVENHSNLNDKDDSPGFHFSIVLDPFLPQVIVHKFYKNFDDTKIGVKLSFYLNNLKKIL